MPDAPKAGRALAPEQRPLATAGYPRACRILHAADFRRVTSKGKRHTDTLYTIFTLANRLSSARLGITVSRQVSPRAVDRNRIKRLVRETFRLEQYRLKGVDIVVIAKPPCRNAPSGLIRSTLLDHWTRIENQCAP